MSLVLQSSGGGQITIQEPATASNFTQTLPAATGEVMVSGNQPAFSATMSANQTVTTSTYTKVVFNTEEFDTNNNYDSTTNYRFTPTVAGYYQVIACIYPATAVTAINCAIYKNGNNFKVFGGTTVSSSVSSLIYFNGSTDYIECYAFLVGATPSILSTSSLSYFNACLVRAA